MQQNDCELINTQHPLVTFEKSSENEIHIVVKGIAGAVRYLFTFYSACLKIDSHFVMEHS